MYIRISKKIIEQFMQHRCEIINQDVSTRGSSSADNWRPTGRNVLIYYFTSMLRELLNKLFRYRMTQQWASTITYVYSRNRLHRRWANMLAYWLIAARHQGPRYTRSTYSWRDPSHRLNGKCSKACTYSATGIKWCVASPTSSNYQSKWSLNIKY